MHDREEAGFPGIGTLGGFEIRKQPHDIGLSIEEALRRLRRQQGVDPTGEQKLVQRLAIGEGLNNHAFGKGERQPPAPLAAVARAMVSQTLGLDPWKTVIDNATFLLIMRKFSAADARKIAITHIKRVCLDKFTGVWPHQLSSGLKQYTGVAQARSNGADFLLTDEPFGAINAQTREFMRAELTRI